MVEQPERSLGTIYTTDLYEFDKQVVYIIMMQLSEGQKNIHKSHHVAATDIAKLDSRQEKLRLVFELNDSQKTVSGSFIG